MIENLSNGYQQRVGIAQAIIHNPEIVILDEPTVGVDIKTRVAIYELIKEFCESGGAVMLISSDLSEIVNLSHRVYILSEENLCAEFNAEDCSEHLIQSYFIKSKAQIVEAS